MNYSVKILVRFKEGLYNPEARVIGDTVREMLGHDVTDFESGKYFSYVSKKPSKKDARREAEDISDRLLINPNIERFEILSIEDISKKDW